MNIEIFTETLRQNEQDLLSKIELFSGRDIAEMMLHFRGSSTSLSKEKVLEITKILDELKKIRDTLSFIQEISRKQENTECLTEEEELFIKYFHMISEFSMMSQKLDDMLKESNSHHTLNERSYSDIRQHFKTRRESLYCWNYHKWTTDFEGMSSRKITAFRMERREIIQIELFSDILKKLDKEISDFYMIIFPEYKTLRSIQIALENEIQQQQLLLKDIEPIFLRELNVLTCCSENVLTRHFDEIMPKFKELQLRHDSFVERCNSQIQKIDLKIKSDTDNDEILFLYMFCKNHKSQNPAIRNRADPLPFPGKQDEGDELILIPPKGERSYENMHEYLTRRIAEYNKKKN